MRKYRIEILEVIAIGCIAIATLIGCTDVSRGRSTQTPVEPEMKKERTPLSSETAAKHTNRLVNETSPYLLQHAHNPVDWYPWGEEAFAKATEEDKPIFLSVGYSSCHWCHVMERESFESEAIAEILNEHFISIKVDREERPDVDEIYMTAVQAMTGSGGWPMSVFLTPDLDPFYGGTYFPPSDAYGKPGFNTLLMRIAEVWKEKRDEVEQGADKLSTHMRQLLSSTAGQSGSLEPAIFDAAVAQLKGSFDREDGGFGNAPKFPNSGGIAVLLRHHARSGDVDSLNAATVTLDKMATGGIYDHLGGGFSRYSTDDKWLVPHFEKMLYDNGQLAQIYIEAYQSTKNPFYAKVVRETLDYVLRDMTDDGGGFYSAEDADSEGEEGKFYLWRYDELLEILGREPNAKGDTFDDAQLFAAYYNVKPAGNFNSHEPYHNGLNVLHTPRSPEAVADEFSITVDELNERMAPMKAKVLAVRSERVRPGLDDKILTSWNGLMITAFAQGYQVLGDERYRDAAVKASRFILNEMTDGDELLRTHRLGESRLPAYLDDYAFFSNALVDVYEATFDPEWLDHATRLTDTMIAKFWDTENPGFYFTSEDHANLIVRTRAGQDNATPSGSSIAALQLLRLAKLTDERAYHDKARALLEGNKGHLSDFPSAFLKLMVAADYLVYPPKEIAIAGTAGGDDTAALLAAIRSNFIPNKVVAFADPSDDGSEALGERLPLLAGKDLLDGKAAAYVCKDYACQRPTNSPDEMTKQLNAP